MIVYLRPVESPERAHGRWGHVDTAGQIMDKVSDGACATVYDVGMGDVDAAVKPTHERCTTVVE